MRLPFPLHAITLAMSLLPVCTSPAVAASPFVGTWTITALQPRQEVTLWLVQLREEEGKLEGKVLGALSESKLEKVQADGMELQLTLRMNDLPYVVTVFAPKEQQPTAPDAPLKLTGENRRLLGSLEARGRRDLVRMDKSALKQFEPDKAVVRGGAIVEGLEKAVALDNPKEREAAIRNLLKQHADQPAAVHLALALVEFLDERHANEVDFRAAADQAIKLASRHGRGMEMQVAAQCADEVLDEKPLAGAALEYAQKAAGLLKLTDSPESKVRILKIQAKALRANGKTSEANVIDQQIAVLDQKLDEDFMRGMLTFRTEPLASQTGAGQRVVLVELFTGAQCPPCVAADAAVWGLANSAKPDQVICLEYHLHAPFPDALTNPDGEKRGAYYDVGGTPFVLLNGEWAQRPDTKGQAQGLGGLLPQAGERYQYLRREVQGRLGKPAQAQIALKVDRQAQTINVKADVSDLKRTNGDARLRIALVEEVVRYPGTNGQRLHHNVVRAFLGGVDGMALKAATASNPVAIDLEQLRSNLAKAIDEYNKVRKFPDSERPLNLDRLKVVAFIQDDKSKEVLQAAQADVPGK